MLGGRERKLNLDFFPVLRGASVEVSSSVLIDLVLLDPFPLFCACFAVI